MAHIAIPLPFTPVPITGQTFAVLLCGALLGARLGAASMLLYITEGLVGLPVFAVAAGSFSYGYLAGFVAAPLLVGWVPHPGRARGLPPALLPVLSRGEATYFFWVCWLARLFSQ